MVGIQVITPVTDAVVNNYHHMVNVSNAALQNKRGKTAAKEGMRRLGRQRATRNTTFSSQEDATPPPLKPIVPPPLNPFNWNPRDTNYAMIVLMVLVNSGMGPLNESMVKIAKEQEAEDKVNSLFIQMTTLLTNIQTSATGNQGPSGNNNPEIKKQLAQLISIMKQLIGPTPQIETINGTVEIVPSKGSALANLLALLKKDNSGQTPPYNPFTDNPAVTSVNSFFKTMQGYVASNTNTSWGGASPTTNMFAALQSALLTTVPSPDPGGETTGLKDWLNIIATNSYYKNNPTNHVNAGTDYLGDSNTNITGITSTFQGMGTQNQALIQTNTTQEGSLDSSGQNIISGNAQQDKTFVQNQNA